MLVSRVPAVALVALALLAGPGCFDDPARENPLDPLSEGFRDEGAVSGQITGLYPPFPGRADVRVRLVPVGPAGRPELATRTDASGQFALSDVPSGPYAVVAEQEGFLGATDTVTIAPGTVAETTIQLDALPEVTEQTVRSVHISRWFPDEPVFQLEVDVAATDPDRPEDVDSAALAVPDLGVSLPLGAVGGETGQFTALFDDTELPAPGLEGLLGRTLRVEVKDAAGNVGLGPPLNLVRVIELSPQTERPQGLEVVSPTPTLVWRPAQLPFAFTYRVDVFLVVEELGLPTLIERREAIGPSITSIDVATELVPGDYFWTVWVVDAFGNRSRSREAGFRVAG